jgi:peptide/nickel transport system permease protein
MAATPAAPAATAAGMASARRRHMRNYVLRRLGLYLVTVWAAVTLAFVLFRLMPGDPIAILLSQLSLLEGKQQAGAENIVTTYRALFGLDQPIHLQYILFIRNIFSGFDFGPSFVAFPTKAQVLIARHLPWTVILFTISMMLAWFSGTALGALIGWMRRNRLASIAAGILSFLQIMPVYLLAIALIVILGYRLGWLPTGRPYDSHLQPAFTWEFLSSVARHMILPMLSMVLVWGAAWAMGMRQLIISILGEDYLGYAKAKGLRPGVILKDYAFRNALLPQIAGLAIALGSTLNGAYIVEVIFGIPGLGELFVRAMAVRDYNVMQGVVILSMVGVLTAGLVVDLSLPLLDPRIRVAH